MQKEVAMSLQPAPVSEAVEMHLYPEEFKAFVGSFPTGVTVVTWGGEDAGGMTVNAFASISMDPPLVMVSLGQGCRALAPVLREGRFGINILSGDGSRAAVAFASGKTANLGDFAWRSGPQGAPQLTEDSTASADCEVHQVIHAGDHTILLGKVCQVTASGTAPLGYLRRRFAPWA